MSSNTSRLRKTIRRKSSDFLGNIHDNHISTALFDDAVLFWVGEQTDTSLSLILVHIDDSSGQKHTLSAYFLSLSLVIYLSRGTEGKATYVSSIRFA